MTRRCELALSALLVTGCSATVVPDAGTPVCTSCSAWAAPEAQGTLPLELSEVSGLAASARNPGVLFAHNDSGDTARFFALDGTGALLATFALPDASAVDWEDVARGPCDAGSCLFFGDVGDNDRVRGRYAVYRVPEPLVVSGQPGPHAVSFERFELTYPDGGSFNAEAILVHPASGDLYVLTKDEPGIASEAFKLSNAAWRAPGSAVLERVATVSVPTSTDGRTTGADLDPCGRRLLVRLTNRLVELAIDGGQPFDSIFQAAPRIVPSAAEPQGEAVAYSVDGTAFFTASERLNPTEPLYRSACRP